MPGYLLDRPPGAWSDLVTNDDLDRADVRTELQAQTKWLATFVTAAQGVVVAAVGAIGALLRFAEKAPSGKCPL